MPKRVVIRGDLLSGYGLAFLIAFYVFAIPFTAYLSKVWRNPVSLELWVIYWIFLLTSGITTEWVVRRTRVEVTADRVRWYFRQPPQQGDEPLTNLTRVVLYPSAAMLEFTRGAGGVAVSRSDFSNREIRRVVEALRGLGVPVEQGEIRAIPPWSTSGGGRTR